MKVLPQGTLRYLLIDTPEVERNYQRRAARGAVAIVAEADPERPGAYIYHNGFGVLVDGPAALIYDPTVKVVLRPDKYRGARVEERAAYATYGRVAVAESVEEAASLRLDVPDEDSAAEAPKAAEKTASSRPSTKQPQVKKPEEGNK